MQPRFAVHLDWAEMGSVELQNLPYLAGVVENQLVIENWVEGDQGVGLLAGEVETASPPQEVEEVAGRLSSSFQRGLQSRVDC